MAASAGCEKKISGVFSCFTVNTDRPTSWVQCKSTTFSEVIFHFPLTSPLLPFTPLPSTPLCPTFLAMSKNVHMQALAHALFSFP